MDFLGSDEEVLQRPIGESRKIYKAKKEERKNVIGLFFSSLIPTEDLQEARNHLAQWKFILHVVLQK